MTFTASEVSSLTRSMERWELAEYIFAGLVTLGCFGEFVGEFTDWFTNGEDARKHVLKKLSTLLLIAALALELVCLVRTNVLSGQVIGSLDERSKAAAEQSAKAVEDSGKAIESSDKAKSSSENAMALASGVRQEANSLKNDLASSKKQLLLLSARYRLIQQGASEIFAAVQTFPGQKIEFQSCRALQTDNETNVLSQSILEIVTKAKWETHSAVWQSCSNAIGVMVYVNEGSSARTMMAANALGKILDKLLRIDRPDDFAVWEKLRDDSRFSPWNWILPISERDPPLAVETVRLSIFGRYPR